MIMLFTQEKNLEESIVELLLEKERLNGKEIQKFLRETDQSVSIQAIYRKLKKLTKNTVVTKTGLIYKIHNEWKKKLRNASKKFTGMYLPEPGAKTTYHFKKFADLEIFFKDLLYAFYEDHPQVTIFCYTHHYFWPYMEQRFQQQENFRKTHAQQKRYAFYNVSGNEILDKHTRKLFTDNYYKITKNRIPSTKDNYHTALIGPYIMSAIFGKETEEQVKRIYTSNTSVQEQIKALQILFNRTETCKLSIEHNLKKCLKQKKQIAKTFLLPAIVKNELDVEQQKLKNQV